MNLTYQERNELNQLSKEVFGASGRWQKLVNTGYAKTVTRDVEETVPAEKDGDQPTTRTVQVPVQHGSGQVREMVTYTVESIREYMLERKEKLDEIKAIIKRQQEEARLKKEQEAQAAKVHQELQGSAI